MENQNKTLVLEPSSNTHLLKGNDIQSEDLGDSVIKVKIKGDGLLLHGEHGVIKTESENFIKYNQLEFNPVTKVIQKAFD